MERETWREKHREMRERNTERGEREKHRERRERETQREERERT